MKFFRRYPGLTAFLIGTIIVFAAILFQGCQSTPQDTPLDPPVITQPVVKYKVTITNSFPTWFIMKISKDDTWIDDHLVIQPQEIIEIHLEAGTYKVCVEKELSGKETCKNKVVSGEEDNVWRIRRKVELKSN